MLSMGRSDVKGLWIRPLSSVNAERPESDGKDRQIRCPFHPDIQILLIHNQGERAADRVPVMRLIQSRDCQDHTPVATVLYLV